MVAGVNISLTRNLEKYKERVRNIPFEEYPLAIHFDLTSGNAYLREKALEALNDVPKATAKYRTTRYSSYSGIRLSVYFNQESLADDLATAVDPETAGWSYEAGMAIRAPLKEYNMLEKWRVRARMGWSRKTFNAQLDQIPQVVQKHI